MASPQSIQLLSPALPVLSALDLPGLTELASQAGLPSFRARQLHAALTKRAVHNWSEITDLSGALRDELSGKYRLRALEVRTHLHSKSDGSEKVLFAQDDGTTVESVLIPSRTSTGKDKLTVCVSSQVGCPAACTFCATGLSGFARNLTVAEIVDQVMFFAHQVRDRQQHITNVVFMGMGEPLLNVGPVSEAVRRLTNPVGFGLGQRHITISTVGIVPQIKKFASWAGQVNLAVSLHAPNDELRTTLVPYNAHFPISNLMDAVLEYINATGRRVSFEYVLLRGVNDNLALVRELAELLRPFRGQAHVNLIPWNPFREGRFIRSEGPDADSFAVELRRLGVNATIRYSKGLDISAACGQLREQLNAT